VAAQTKMRKLFIFPALLFAAMAWSQTPSPRQSRQTKTSNPKNPSAQDRRGTEESPLFIKEIPTTKTDDESAQDAKERAEKSANDRKVANFTEILALVGALQLVVFGLQSYYLRRTVEAAGEQSADMKRSIAEANRLATAMEEVAKDIAVSTQAAIDSVAALRERTAQQMRAYLCVIIGSGDYQDRAKNFKFASRPMLINAGHTPAHKVSYKAKAAIFPVPLPEDFTFPLTGESIGAALVGPQQNATMGEIVDEFCDDTEVADIRIGNGKALYIWGIVSYEDVFGHKHFTKFCQTTHFATDNKVYGFFMPKHNDAD